jgi:hypothetical protein
MSRRVALVLALFLALVATPAEAKKAPEAEPGYTTGSAAPELTMIQPDGTLLRLSDLRGSYVLLDLSTMWCGPSQHMAARARTLADALNTKQAKKALGAAFVYVTAELDGFTPDRAPTPELVSTFTAWFRLGGKSAPVVSFGPESSATYLAAQDQLGEYSGGAVPTLVLIDPRGVIMNVLVGERTADALKAEFAPTLPFLADPDPGSFGTPPPASATVTVELGGVTTSLKKAALPATTDLVGTPGASVSVTAQSSLGGTTVEVIIDDTDGFDEDRSVLPFDVGEMAVTKVTPDDESTVKKYDFDPQRSQVAATVGVTYEYDGETYYLDPFFELVDTEIGDDGTVAPWGIEDVGEVADFVAGLTHWATNITVELHNVRLRMRYSPQL